MADPPCLRNAQIPQADRFQFHFVEVMSISRGAKVLTAKWTFTLAPIASHCAVLEKQKVVATEWAIVCYRKLFVKSRDCHCVILK